MQTGRLTKEIIQAAIGGFEAQKQQIEQQITELRSMLGGGSPPTPAEPKPGKTRRKMSAAAIQRIREGQRKRWAAARGESSAPQAAAPIAAKAAKPKRKLSAAGRKAIVDALKRRWAAKKAAGKRAA